MTGCELSFVSIQNFYITFVHLNGCNPNIWYLPMARLTVIACNHSWANFRDFYENPREFSKLLPSFLPQSLKVFEDPLNIILVASRWSHSWKLSKFENENENPLGLEVLLTALVPTKINTMRMRTWKLRKLYSFGTMQVIFSVFF